MIKNDVIEEIPMSEPFPRISNVVLPNPDDSFRLTLDEGNINKVINSSNPPLPGQEDIKIKLKNILQVGLQIGLLTAETPYRFRDQNHFLCKYQVLSI